MYPWHYQTNRKKLKTTAKELYCYFTVAFITFDLISNGLGGAGGNRTLVQTRKP